MKHDLSDIEFPSVSEKEESIAWILSKGISPPRKTSSMLGRIWHTAGIQGIFFGVWDCMLLALLLDGLLWAAVWLAVRQDETLLYVLVFLASPLLYAMLHLLTAWKEKMSGMYPILAVCRLSPQQLTALRLLLFTGISVLLSGFLSLGTGNCFPEIFSAVRFLSLSTAALFFYAWMQILLEYTWRHRAAYTAPPVLWSCFCILLLAAGSRGQLLLAQIPTAAFIICAFIFSILYFHMLHQYLCRMWEAPVSYTRGR